MSLSFNRQPSSRSFVDNPVIFGISTTNAIVCTLAIGGQEVASFNHVPFNEECEIDIADVLSNYMDSVPMGINYSNGVEVISDRNSIAYTFTITSGIENISFSGVAFNGGISKQLHRELSSRNLDIFSYRLMNYQRQFLFTTRTNGRSIRIREDEIQPLVFIAPATSITLVTENGRLFVLPSLVANGVYALYLNAVRKAIYDTYNELPSFFSVMVNFNYVFEIIITPAMIGVDTSKVLFRNSLGCFDCIALSGEHKFNVLQSEVTEYEVFDEITGDYLSQAKKMQHHNSYAISVQKPLSELNLLQDMIASSECYLQQDDINIPVKVKISQYSITKESKYPISLSVTIEKLDKECCYSPQLDLNHPRHRNLEWIMQSGSINSWGIIYNDRQIIES